MALADSLWRAQHTFDAVMRGTASAGNGTPANFDLIRLNVGCNKGAFTEAPAWIEQATRIELTGGPNIYAYVRHAGGNVVWSQDSGAGMGDDTNVDVLLNGVAWPIGAPVAWNQPLNATYTMNSVPAGVHRFELQGNGSVAPPEFTFFYRLRVQQYPYQGLGTEDDEGELLAWLRPWVSTIGIGRTDLGGSAAHNTYAEGPLHRVPLGSGLTDQTPARAALNWGGWTAWNATAADTQPLPVWAPTAYKFVSGGAVWEYLPPAAGQSFALGAAATRGCRMVGGTPFISLITPELAAQAVFMLICPMLVRVTAPAGSSNFEAGEPALAIATRMTTALATNMQVYINAHTVDQAIDLFKLEEM
jgi:hypothetical protein